MITVDITHPDIIKEWHPTKNGELKASDFTHGSNKKIWWLCKEVCPEGCLHEWNTTLSKRIGLNRGCPWCSGSRICIHKSILHTHPEVANEWHMEKNSHLNIKEISAGSEKKVWWLCSKSCKDGCIHEYQAIVCNRANGACKWCSGRNVCIHNSIVTTHPQLVAEFHPEKNKDIDPSTLSSRCSVRINWLCKKTCEYGCKHEWNTTISNRIVLNRGCPYCCNPPQKICYHKSLKFTHPDIASQWDYTKNNGLKPEDFTIGSEKKVHWICPKTCPQGCAHEWDAVINSRGRCGCPYCSNQLHCEHVSIKYTHPHLVKEWHPTKNGKLLPEHFTSGSHSVKIWWVCNKNKGHEWPTYVSNRCKPNSNSCPICRHKTEARLNAYLKEKYPNIKCQFKIESCKNKTYLPFDFCIPELKLIIEIDGMQHFTQISNWQCSEKTRMIDIFKMQKAIKEGYKIIRIFQEDVYNNDDAWLSEHLLPEILNEDRNHVFISMSDTLYDAHIKLLNSDIEIILNSSGDEQV